MSEKSVSKPGEAALVNLKLIKAESSIFKIPKIPHMKVKKKRSTVLDEDMYVEVSRRQLFLIIYIYYKVRF